MTLLGTHPVGGDRFKIRRRLGAGSMGVVYEAHDRERDEIVALKTLLHAEANALYRFKREFRSLADTHHRNLVALHELFVADHQCFFTMERVVGVNFLEYVRPEPLTAATDPTFEGDSLTDASHDDTTEHRPPRTDGHLDDTAEHIAPLHSDHDALADTGAERPPSASHPLTAVDPRPARTAVDLTRLRDALGQLADGVAALHRAGIVHRDLKPSNVLVADDGRVVILDFGLATELVPRSPGAPEADEDGLTGTAAYMAPEQVSGTRGAPASDWYAVGVMLYEALSGARPYTGPLLQVLLAKRTQDPPPLAQIAPHAPADLVELCESLMRRDPEARPDDAAILRRLGRVAPEPLTRSHDGVTLFGRASHLAALRDAHAATTRGQAVVVYVHGPSGAGKSALVRGFLAELAAAPDARPVILSGRCYVRESVPYKALDPIVDSLSRFLVAMPEDQARVLMPRDLWALARLFPVMQTVVEALHGHSPAAPVIDQVELRRRAFTALRDLLGRLADRRRLVLTIDDLQWADADSALLLEDLLRPPDAPALLLLASFRSEEIEHQPFLRELLAHADTPARRALAVGPLQPDDTRDLVRDLLGPIAGGPAAATTLVDRIIRESAGSPFLAEQLAHYVSQETGAAATGISLGEMLDAQFHRQPPEARALLDLLAVAAHPLRPALAFAAAGLHGDERPLIKRLRAAKLLRLSAGSESLELYHDRIREALAAAVGPDRRRKLHRALASALEAGGAEPEILFVHFNAAGQVAKALGAAVRAAEKATRALAFDQAAQFYRHALELGRDLAQSTTQDSITRARLEEGLADALANAGRCQPAAEAFLRAAAYYHGAKALDLRRCAAEQLLVSGHINAGRAVLAEVLAQVGLRLAATPNRALLSLIKRRLQLKLHGMRYTVRPESEVPPADLLRIDICSVVSLGLSMNDTIRAADFQALGTLLALRCGEPVRLARALAMEASFVASGGGPAQAQALRLSHAALELARQVGNPAAIGHALLSAGSCAYLAGGDWRRAADLCAEGEATFRERVPGSTWAKTTIRRFWLGSLMYLGELAELRRRLDEFLADARDRGNVYALTDMRARLNLAWLVAGEPAEARRQLAEAMQNWTTDGYHVQHFNALLSQVQADLYEADPAAAVPRIEAAWPALTGSLLMRIQLIRAEAHQLRARAAIASLTGAPSRGVTRAIEHEIDALAREKMAWIDPIADLLRAGLLRAQGRPAAAIARLRAALQAFQTQRMGLYAAVAERQLGLLLGTDEGARLHASAEAWMLAQTVRDPAAIARVFAPGLT
ncbi:serine/threonine-protein kinase [Nannocystis sp.]|uniref:serine/threonine-protein kinase n=1 Tax=Nannocystis sp. TaxID=1962667 RepID=UPI0025DC6AE0|nr:serine/threonine-protein kinase [Nannocystis sp.]MBK7824290.1 protein kinase [Nannocystis sp.]